MKIYVIYRVHKKDLKEDRLFRENGEIIAISTDKEEAEKQINLFNFRAKNHKCNYRLTYEELELKENKFYLKGINL